MRKNIKNVVTTNKSVLITYLDGKKEKWDALSMMCTWLQLTNQEFETRFGFSWKPPETLRQVFWELQNKRRRF